jgi:hypothetical protein
MGQGQQNQRDLVCVLPIQLPAAYTFQRCVFERCVRQAGDRRFFVHLARCNFLTLYRVFTYNPVEVHCCD